MRKIASALVTTSAVAALSLASAPSASAAPDSGYDCGFSRDVMWLGNAYWNNCVNHNQSIVMTYVDTLTNKFYSGYQCVEAGQVEMLMPTFYVVTADVGASC